MKVDAALIREQGVSFVVVAVKQTAMTAVNRDQVVSKFGAMWGGVPAVLMAQTRGRPATFYGRPDLVRFIRAIPVERLPWRSWTAA